MVSYTKRGQSAAGAALFLAIVAGLLIMFIILMPPQERAELLGDKSSSSSISSSSGSGASNLLLTSPGKIDYLARRDMEHPLPVVQVFTQAQSEIMAEKNLVYARKSLFGHEESIFKFTINDLINTKEVMLNFKVKSVSGRLNILLNGETIFNAPTEADNSLTLNLPQNSLKENNELIFGVSSPGIAFWATNEVSIEEAKVVGQITNLEGQYSKQVFLVSETEKRNLEKVVLRFQPECRNGEVGKLKVTLNNNEIYNGIPDCELSLVPIEISPNLVQDNENNLVFQTERGRYVLSHVSVISKLKELDFPTYYFGLSHETYSDIVDGSKSVELKVYFVDDGESKYGDILVNGHYYGFDTKALSLAVNISSDVVQGNNAIKIKPRKTVEVRELRADLIS
ncbi:MAG: hypothetical protein AABX04_02135 [Nanoarchaeota archaeon]|mgnify:CR=1 FL=1